MFLAGRSSKVFCADSMELHLVYKSIRRLVRKMLKVRAVLIKCEWKSCASFSCLVVMHFVMSGAYWFAATAVVGPLEDMTALLTA